MDTYYELSDYEARQLLSELMMADSKSTNGLRKLRVWVGPEGVKFKVNEYIWSPPMGKVQVVQ